MPVYKVEICGVNTSKLPLLSNEEKEELFRRILKGDREAREQYILSLIHIFIFPFPSVGAVENALFAAVAAVGRTVLRGCAREPEIGQLCHFLNLSLIHIWHRISRPIFPARKKAL